MPSWAAAQLRNLSHSGAALSAAPSCSSCKEHCFDKHDRFTHDLDHLINSYTRAPPARAMLCPAHVHTPFRCRGNMHLMHKLPARV